MIRTKQISYVAMWTTLAIVLATNVVFQQRQQQELDRRGLWMHGIDANIKHMLERHEAEDLVRKPEDVPDRFTGSQAEMLIERIEALEERVRVIDD